ncbi:anthrax toxin receptor 1-like isoform X2 [Corticium candelabrum]|uniref:anthrax toxin receptor 1-like isoform X2 n=1 Tax=Corticium candelabrum TaxID=121492 RepID=UPI002E2581DA|nr:anthrax toxin receptor 1-like isoform X2 [Corticium candelabrum]
MFICCVVIKMRVASASVCCLAILLAAFFSFNRTTAADLKPCRGAFDVIFVLDRSGSVGGLFATSTVAFVQDISSRFVSPLLGISFITFSNHGELHLRLTSNRTAVNEALTELNKLRGSGGTKMYTGLEKAVDQIQNKSENTVSIILVLTDGQDNNIDEAVKEAEKARQFGAVVFAVGVADFSHEQLVQVADKPASEHVFEAQRFDDLPKLVESIINRTCIEILSAEPTELCREFNNRNHSIVINGNGFTRGRKASDILCKFKFNASFNHITRPQYPVQDYRLVCNFYAVSENARGIVLQVSVNNGHSYVSSNVFLNVIECGTTRVTPVIKKSSLEVSSAEPTELCGEGNHSITVHGNAFTRVSEISCNFTFNTTWNYVTRPQYPVQHNHFVCKLPIVSKDKRDIILRVSVNNGNSRVSRNFSLKVTTCESSAANMSLIIAVIVIAFILLLALLWWFWPLCIGGRKPEPEVEEEKKQPSRNVSASYYGGRGAGGISTMRVDWGDKGSTKEGSKLTPAKDATVTEPPSDQHAEEPGCCDQLKGAFASCWASVVAKYVYLASFRPVRGRSVRIA